MISTEERETIIRCATKFGAAAVFLFGSSLLPDHVAHDIDIGVKGIAPRRFFKFYGELIRLMPKPVDVVDLTHDSLFNQLVQEKGQKILG